MVTTAMLKDSSMLIECIKDGAIAIVCRRHEHDKEQHQHKHSPDELAFRRHQSMCTGFKNCRQVIVIGLKLVIRVRMANICPEPMGRL